MDFQNGDHPFDGASPSAPQMHDESESYDDLLGVQVPVGDFDYLPVADFEEEEYDAQSLSYMAPVANMMNSQCQGPDATDYPQDPNPLKTKADPGNTLKESARTQKQSEEFAPTLACNSSSQRTSPAEIQASRLDQKAPKIKKEALDTPFTLGIPLNTIDEPVEISDTEDTAFVYKHGNKMKDDTIFIPERDEEDDILIVQPDGSSVPIKKEDDEVEFLWEKMEDRVIELDSDNETNAALGLSLGKSFLKGLDPNRRRPRIDRSAAMRAQEAYLRVRRLNNGISEPSARRGALNEPGLQGPNRSELPMDDDESAWMKADYTPDEDNGTAFRALKKSYNARVKTDSNTIADDVEFTKAEKAERLRLARLKAEYKTARGYSDDNDSDNSDDGLFLSPPPTTSRPKRRALDSPDGEDENRESRRTKQRKPNGNGKRPRQGLDQEQETNMMAGLEEFIRKNCREDGDKSGGKGKGKSGTKGSKRAIRRSKKSGYLNGSNSLLTSNVYEDADANLDREALPVSGHTHKQKALAALVASVPLGTTPKDAAAEKNRIRKATVTLGRNVQGSCKADGTDQWKLPGLKSSLRHHQVLGAAFLVDRENGGEEPLGGILVSPSSP